MLSIASAILVRYALLEGPATGRSVPMGPSEMTEIEVECDGIWELYVLVPGKAAYRWEP